MEQSLISYQSRLEIQQSWVHFALDSKMGFLGYNLGCHWSYISSRESNSDGWVSLLHEDRWLVLMCFPTAKEQFKNLTENQLE
jgi:hypothetical protein